MEPSKRLKQLHWIKINDRKVKDTIWESMRDEECTLENDVIEDMFAAKVVASVLPSSNDNDDSLEEGGGGKRKKKVVILLSANRSQTIGVLL